ncbi:MAG: DUF3098 domain-containing protein [Bacteroidota bacterium]
MEKNKPAQNFGKKPVQPPKVVVSSTPKQAVSSKTADFAFTRENYRLMLIGLAFIVVGFILMIGGGSANPNDFSPKIFDFQRITLSPILILTGFVIEIFAIMKKPKD